MKKIITTIIIIIFLACPLIVNAAGSFTVTPNSVKVGVGREVSLTVKAVNAIGDTTVTSQDETIVKVTSPTNGNVALGEGGADQTKTGTIKIKGIKEGTAKLTVVIDAVSYDEENLGTTQEINVTVEAGNPSTGVSLTAIILTITALAGAAYIIRKNQTAKFFG